VRFVPVTPHGQLPANLVTRLDTALREQRTLGDVLTWARAQRPPRTVTEIVTQDEYTHDVIMAVEEDVYLVFDTT
jgi:hypothetical protein